MNNLSTSTKKKELFETLDFSDPAAETSSGMDVKLSTLSIETALLEVLLGLYGDTAGTLKVPAVEMPLLRKVF